MKTFAYMILMTIVVMIIIQPIMEVAEVCREQVMISSATSNAFRAARDRSLIYENQRELDAVAEIDDFMDYFAEAFADTLNLSIGTMSYGNIEFYSYNDLYDDFTVEIDLYEETDFGGDVITTVEINVSTNYKFKNKILKMITEQYELKQNRSYILSVKN